MASETILKQKEEELKKRLKKKFVNVVPVEPVMHTVKEDIPLEEIKEKPVKKKKMKEKLVDESEINLIEETTLDEEIEFMEKSISKKNNELSKEKKAVIDIDDALLEEIMKGSQRRKENAKKVQKAKKVIKKEEKKLKMDDYDIDINMDEIFKNIKDLENEDDILPKGK